MDLLSVNVGHVQPIPHAKLSGVTGIFKQPVAGLAQVTRLGLPGDAVCDVENHGGPDQAIYVYGDLDYAWWLRELGEELAPGTFGENLTVRGLESAAFLIGDRLRIREVILEVTAPRIPCVTLNVRLGDPAFGKRFREAERPGLYCRVIQEGMLQAGDPVSHDRFAGPAVSLVEMFRDYYRPSKDEAVIRHILSAPIAIRARIDIEKRLLKGTGMV